MIIKTISSVQALEELANIDWNSFPVQRHLLEHYFSSGNLIRVSVSKDSFPVLLYPTKLRLREMIKEKNSLKSHLEKKQSFFRNNLNRSKNYFFENNLKKFSNPLYWKHLSKYLIDKQYRQAADAVKLPIALVNDKRWQPMIRTFLDDKDYRAQLVETVSESIVYKKDRRVARYADRLQDFRIEEFSRNLKLVEEKLSKITKDIEVMHALMKWASK